jgi:hypothetical protein
MKEKSHLDVKYVTNALLEWQYSRNIMLAFIRERNCSNVIFVNTNVPKRFT